VTGSAGATDTARLIRRAARTVVARRGFHGASMSAIAAEAGLAVGTAYVHYRSKDELLVATYVEVKQELGAAATAELDRGAPARARFIQMWTAVHRHLCGDPDRAAFLVQFEASPFAGEGHERAMSIVDDPLMREAAAPDMAAQLVDLPPVVLYDLAFGALVRAVAGGVELDRTVAGRMADACWRAITARQPRATSDHREARGQP
jgi:TetR/AcrR family transcriptional repressor of multidrug resistance operon